MFIQTPIIVVKVPRLYCCKNGMCTRMCVGFHVRVCEPEHRHRMSELDAYYHIALLTVPSTTTHIDRKQEVRLLCKVAAHRARSTTGSHALVYDHTTLRAVTFAHQLDYLHRHAQRVIVSKDSCNTRQMADILTQCEEPKFMVNTCLARLGP